MSGVIIGALLTAGFVFTVGLISALASRKAIKDRESGKSQPAASQESHKEQ